MTMYKSDITRFLEELKARRPELEQEQQRGRAIWWDKPQDLDTSRRNAESKVAQQAYVYQTLP